MTENTDLLKKIADEISEVKFWLKLSGLPFLQRTISECLRSNEEKMVYELSDGVKSTREISTKLKNRGVSVTHATVANMWRRWAVVGLVEPSREYKGRFSKVISLESLGVDLPNEPEQEG